MIESYARRSGSHESDCVGKVNTAIILLVDPCNMYIKVSKYSKPPIVETRTPLKCQSRIKAPHTTPYQAQPSQPTASQSSPQSSTTTLSSPPLSYLLVALERTMIVETLLCGTNETSAIDSLVQIIRTPKLASRYMLAIHRMLQRGTPSPNWGCLTLFASCLRQHSGVNLARPR
jgi:hypothetical protein